MLDRLDLFLHLSRRPLYRFPPTGIGQSWRALPAADLIEHARKMRDSFAGGKGHIFIHFFFRCEQCGKVSRFERPNAYWHDYRCKACGGVGTFAAGWYYLAINPWHFQRFNVVEGTGNVVELP